MYSNSNMIGKNDIIIFEKNKASKILSNSQCLIQYKEDEICFTILNISDEFSTITHFVPDSITIINKEVESLIKYNVKSSEKLEDRLVLYLY